MRRALLCDSQDFEAEGRVLRLKNFIGSDVGPEHIDIILEALAVNTRVQALYIQNFEKGMGDAQVGRLIGVLRMKRIRALNIGENFRVSAGAWADFADRLHETAVGYLYVSEVNLRGTPLKKRMRDAIRANRRHYPLKEGVARHVTNMWYNPTPATKRTTAPTVSSSTQDSSADASTSIDCLFADLRKKLRASNAALLMRLEKENEELHRICAHYRAEALRHSQWLDRCRAALEGGKRGLPPSGDSRE